MFSHLLKRIWAGHNVTVGVAAGDALASISIIAGATKTQMITEEGRKGRLNMASLMGRYQPVLSAVEEAQLKGLIENDKQDELGPEILVVEDGIEGSNVGGVAKPKMLAVGIEEIGIFTLKEDCESIMEIGIFTSKEDCKTEKDISVFNKKAVGGIRKRGLKGEIKPQPVFQNDQKEESIITEKAGHVDVLICPELLEERMTKLSEEISRDIQDLEILLKARKGGRLKGSINMVEDEEDSFSKETSDVVSMAEICEENDVTVGVLVVREVDQFIKGKKNYALRMSHDERMKVKVDLDPGKEVIIERKLPMLRATPKRVRGARSSRFRTSSTETSRSIEQEFTTLKVAPKRVRGARSSCFRTRRVERSRSNELGNGETGRRCQRVKRISWALSRGKERTCNAKSKPRGRQSAPLAHRVKIVRPKKKKFAIVPEEASAMFNVKHLDEDNQARILALQEDEIAKKEEVWGRMKAAAWGNLHTLVPVSVEERRGSLVPLTGCKCEGADTTPVTDINHNVVGPHMAVVVMDRRKHGAMGADLGIGQAGAGAAHLPECQKLCDEEDRLLQEEAIKREAVRKAEAAKEYQTKRDNTRRLLAEVNRASSIPKEEGRASLARKARRAEADRVATSKAKIDRARRCVFALQKLKADLPIAETLSGPPGAQSGGFEPFNALGGEEEKNEVFRSHNEMRARIRNESLTSMQRKLIQNVLKKKAAKDTEEKFHQ